MFLSHQETLQGPHFGSSKHRAGWSRAPGPSPEATATAPPEGVVSCRLSDRSPALARRRLAGEGSRLGGHPGPGGTRGVAPAGQPWASSGQLRVPQESTGPLSCLLSSQARRLGQVQRRGCGGGESGGEGAAPGEGCGLQGPSLQGVALPHAPASGPELQSWVQPPQTMVTLRNPFLNRPRHLALL